jgi:hypothetical protein
LMIIGQARYFARLPVVRKHRPGAELHAQLAVMMRSDISQFSLPFNPSTKGEIVGMCFEVTAFSAVS